MMISKVFLEAESEGHLVEGLAFHRNSIKRPRASDTSQFSSSVSMARHDRREHDDNIVVINDKFLRQKLPNGEAITAHCKANSSS